MNNKNLKPVKNGNEAKEKGRIGGIKSGEVRRERAKLRSLGYTEVESFDKLNEIQHLALLNGNYNAAAKIEELKGKLAGLYVQKIANTDAEGNDFLRPIINIRGVAVENKEEKAIEEEQPEVLLSCSEFPNS